MISQFQELEDILFTQTVSRIQVVHDHFPGGIDPEFTVIYDIFTGFPVICTFCNGFPCIVNIILNKAYAKSRFTVYRFLKITSYKSRTEMPVRMDPVQIPEIDLIAFRELGNFFFECGIFNESIVFYEKTVYDISFMYAAAGIHKLDMAPGLASTWITVQCHDILRCDTFTVIKDPGNCRIDCTRVITDIGRGNDDRRIKPVFCFLRVRE